MPSSRSAVNAPLQMGLTNYTVVSNFTGEGTSCPRSFMSKEIYDKTDTTVPVPLGHAMEAGADPYEQQLLAVFESCCEKEEGKPGGALDGKGLARLCEKLQLEEQAPQLIERLLGRDSTSSRQITFPQFREALLALLAGRQAADELDTSPEREVRPKFVYGEKKYGRRSRPDNSEPESDQEASGSDSEGCSRLIDSPMPLQEKSSIPDGELNAKKRRTSPEKNLRETNVDQVDQSIVQGWGKDTVGLSEEEECLRATWERLGAGHEGYLGRPGLVLVCQSVGLEKVADELVEQLFNRLGVDPDGRISFEQFLHLFRSGLSGNATSEETDHQLLENHRGQRNSCHTFHVEESSKDTAFFSLDTCNSGMVSAEQVLELWETAGVQGAARLLHDLGLGSAARRPISLSELSSALEEEARVLVEEQRSSVQEVVSNPLTALLHASLLIHQAEAKCLKGAIEQVIGERDKLRQDLDEANERASLLAQEVDDRHARLEQTSQQQTRMQEQRHAEEVRNLQDLLSAERDQLAALTTGLELRLGQMQGEEVKLRAEVATLTERSESLEKDNSNLRERLSATEELKSQLWKKVESLPELQLRLSELEGEQAEVQAQQVRPLLERLEAISSENISLRDENDELKLKLEAVASRQTAKKFSNNKEVESPGRAPGGGKRRGGLSNICSDDSSEEDSPRLGKLRKCVDNGTPCEDSSEEVKRLKEQVSLLQQQLEECKSHLQSGGKGGGLSAPLSSCNTGSATEKPEPQLQLKQVFHVVRSQILREILEDSDSQIETPLLNQIATLQTRCQDLTQLQKTMEAEFEMQLDQAREEKECEVEALRQAIESMQKRFKEQPGSENCETEKDLAIAILSHMDDVGGPGSAKDMQQLEQHCRDLKKNLDQVKVEIVRILSDKEAASKENSALREHISGLTNNTETVETSTSKIENTDHEKPASETKTVQEDDEKMRLRTRVAELEASLDMMREEYEKCEDYWQGKLDDERRLFEQEQTSTDERFAELEDKIKEYEELLCQEQSGAGDEPARLSPIEERFGLEKQVTDMEEECEELRQHLEALEREHENCMILPERLDVAVQTEGKVRSISLLSSISSCSLLSKDKFTQVDFAPDESSRSAKAPSPGKRTNVYHGELKRFQQPPENFLHQDMKTKTGYNGGVRQYSMSRVPEQSCRVQLNVMQALGARLQLQEQTSRRLDAALKQHQNHTERLMHQHHEEVASLQATIQSIQARLHQHALAYEEQGEKLVCSDMLVKDLYIENSLLISTIERLEQRCVQLSQHAPGSA